MTLGQRLRKARTDANLVLREVGERCGVSPQAVAQWEADQTKPSAAALSKIATLTGVPLGWLFSGVDDSKDDSPIAYNGEVGRVLPSVPWDDLERYQSGDTSAISGRVRSHFMCGDESFQTFIRDRSNEPELIVGDSIIVDPDIQPSPGELCLARVDGQFMVRRLHVRADHIELAPSNPAWPIVRAASLADVVIGAVVEFSRRTR